jgi:hypothetical protein
MPTYTIPADGTNRDIYSLEQARVPGYFVPSFAKLRYYAESDGIKVGGKSMTATEYDFPLLAEQRVEDGRVMTSNRYVRNDSGAPVVLHVNFDLSEGP